MKLRSGVIFTIVIGIAVFTGGARSAEPPSPQPQQEVTPMLSITWTRGPDLPQGLQDSAVGFLGDDLVLVGGFCQGFDDNKKPGHYPRGFVKKAWAWNLRESDRGWTRIPDFPGEARQGLIGMTVGNALYCWGGFNYSAPFARKDGYRLLRREGSWTWEPLPPLPYPLYACGVCADGTKIYISGGADYDGEQFYSNTDRNGANPRLGAHLWVLDTKDLSAGWKQLADCPGTPRWTYATAVVKGKIYLLGGATAQEPYATVVDNWRYDPAADKWTRLRDLPISSGNFAPGRIVYKDRYIILPGGFQYPKVANPDGTYRDKYGKASQVDGVFVPRGDRNGYYNDVFVYDTRTNLFGRADPLPINNNATMTVVRGDEIFELGGEADARVIDGEYYGHHPDLFLRGKIQELKP